LERKAVLLSFLAWRWEGGMFDILGTAEKRRPEIADASLVLEKET